MIDKRIGLSLYMAPEVIYEKKFGPKADIYSFGIIAYEILTNDKSFTDIANNYESFDAVPRNIFPNLSLITNDNLRDMVMKCLSSDPNKRPTTEEIISILDDKKIQKDIGVTFKDFQKYFTFQCLEKAKKNDPEALNRLGCIRDYSKANKDETLHFYDEAIKLGNPRAMFNKSSMLYFGRNCSKDIDEAIKLMKMAVDHNNSNAMTNYGCLLFYGLNVPRDTEDGLYYLNSAKKQNNPFAFLNLGRIYLNGYSVPQNVGRGIQLIEQAANMENTDALVELARIYRRGTYVQKNLDEAIRLLKKAVELYSNEARCLLAEIYVNEESVKNEKEALRLLDEAIEDGCPEAYRKKDYLERNIKFKDEDGDLIDVCYIDFFDGLPIEKPKNHHIAYLKKKDFTSNT